jgi:uncharacterized protein (DUF362 family)
LIFINYGKDWVKTTYDTLKASDIGIYLKAGMSVSIKPNLVTPQFGVSLIDLNDDRCVTLQYENYDIRICETALKTDFLINVPVLKAHCQTRLTCCMKNLKGCPPSAAEILPVL